MAEYVQEGSKILASQYNALVDAMCGPAAPAEGIPFTQTKNGTVLNGGRPTTPMRQGDSTQPLFNIAYGCDYQPSAFTEEGNLFDGIWVQMTSWDKVDYLCKHTYMLGLPVQLFVIDDGDPSGKLVWSPAFDNNQNINVPLCTIQENAGVAVYSAISENASQLGAMQTIVVIGNFEKFGAADGAYASGASKSQILQAAKAASAGLLSNVDDLALREFRPIYVAPDEDFASNSKAVSYKIGQLECETLPDAFQGVGWPQYNIGLSSLDFTPVEQVGGGGPQNVQFATFSYSIYKFDKLSATYDSLSALKEANDLSDMTPSDDRYWLSSFDFVVRHKEPHPNSEYEGQAYGRVEYLPISSLALEADSALSSLGLSSMQIQQDSENGRYVQLYKFDDPTLVEVDEQTKDDYDIVLREHSSTDGAKINYMSLASLSSIISGGGGVDLSVDSEVTQLSSIDWQQENVLELYNFSGGTRVEKEDTFDIVVRDNENGKIDYTPLSALGSGYPGPWEITINKTTGDATFTNCVAKVARAYHFFANQTANVGGGDKMVYFVMDHSASPAVHMYVGNYSNAASILGGTDANCISASITPLYRVVDNEVACDFRYMMNIQAYDNRNFSTTMPY